MEAGWLVQRNFQLQLYSSDVKFECDALGQMGLTVKEVPKPLATKSRKVCTGKDHFIPAEFLTLSCLLTVGDGALYMTDI